MKREREISNLRVRHQQVFGMDTPTNPLQLVRPNHCRKLQHDAAPGIIEEGTVVLEVLKHFQNGAWVGEGVAGTLRLVMTTCFTAGMPGGKQIEPPGGPDSLGLFGTSLGYMDMARTYSR